MSAMETEEHYWRFVASHGNGAATADEYDYCMRCGTMRRSVLVETEIKARNYTAMSGQINTTEEPPCWHLAEIEYPVIVMLPRKVYEYLAEIYHNDPDVATTIRDICVSIRDADRETPER